MATRKAKKATEAPKKRAQAIEARRSDRVAPTNQDDQGRLLREAAWSRMFGRLESKNPFAR